MDDLSRATGELIARLKRRERDTERALKLFLAITPVMWGLSLAASATGHESLAGIIVRTWGVLFGLTLAYVLTLNFWPVRCPRCGGRLRWKKDPKLGPRSRKVILECRT